MPSPHPLLTRRRASAAAGLALAVSSAMTLAPGAAAHHRPMCTPTGASQVVCPAGAPIETATFIDPAARLTSARHIRLGRLVYVAPFARLDASGAPIKVGAESNIEDQARVIARGASDGARRTRLAAVGLRPSGGIAMAPRTVLGHDASVIGPARIGFGGTDIEANADGVPEVILNQGAQVDGAILEKNTAVSALARVGPGVVLRSGKMVMPGKNVTTQEQADDPALGKVIELTAADVAGTELSVDANTGFAREYSRLYREHRPAVRGIGPDPGGTEYSGARSTPVTGAESGTCDGRTTVLPGFRARIIGSVCLADPVSVLQRVIGEGVSLRADEGSDVPYIVGHVRAIEDDVVFHDVPDSGITVGDDTTIGRGATVHSGPGRDAIVRDGATIESEAVVFGSDIGKGARVGSGSLVGFTDVADGTTVPPKVIVFGGHQFGEVEW
jgi:carbonic anhydrase/acetyltransferase-like protein (isoleucine patch superfamily)